MLYATLVHSRPQQWAEIREHLFLQSVPLTGRPHYWMYGWCQGPCKMIQQKHQYMSMKSHGANLFLCSAEL